MPAPPDWIWLLTAALGAASAGLGTACLRLQHRLKQAPATEKLAQHAEAMLRDMSNNLPVVVYEYVAIQGGPGHFNFVGERVGALFGMGPALLMQNALRLTQHMHPDDVGEFRRRMRQAQVEREPWQMDYRICHPDGHLRWVRGVARVRVTAFSGTAPADALVWTGYWADVTAIKEMELTISAAREAALAASQAKSDFLANMSHEIRTPLNAILGLSHLLLQTPGDTRQAGYVAKIHQSGQHLLGIVNDILDFSKVEAGKLGIEQVELDLASVLDNVATLVAGKAQSKGLELVFDIAADVPRELLGDPLRLGQILINYASNAIKFTEQGEIVVAVQAEAHTEHEMLLRFSVRDTGMGLSQAQMARLFTSFEQAESSTTRRFGGTGLGLAISKRLAELMGGQVGVHSRLGEGSEFWFTAALCRRPRAGAQPSHLDLKVDLRGRRLLVVDDNASARHAMQAMLENLSFTVATADSGSAALASIEAADRAGQPFDLVLLDWQMPGLDGVQTAHAIRGMALQAPPRMLMVTGHGSEDIGPAAQQAGVSQILLKPVNPSLLFDHVMQALGATAGATATPLVAARHTDLGPLRGRRILLAEDNEINQEVALGLLGSAGLRVRIAHHGQEAVDLIQQAPFDLVLMDMQMPVLDGVSATRAIRALGRYGHIPIVAMTANAMAADRQLCLDAGMVDFLTKPIEPDALWQTLLRWLDIPAAAAVAPDLAPPAVATPADAAAPELPDIAGLDTRLGLRRVMGNVALYATLLRKFAQGQRDVPQALRQALARGDHALAVRLAHTLKGVAGNLGASALQQAADDAEVAFARPGTAAVAAAPLVDAVSAQLVPVIDGLDAWLRRHDTPPPVDAGATLAAPQALAQLQALLAENDPAACPWLQAHQAALQQALGAAYGDIAECIDNYDFDEALALLRRGAAAAPAVS